MASEAFTYKCIILESREYKEKDRILTVLNPEHGIISVCAKGVSKLGSKFAAVSVPFSICDLTLSNSAGYLYLKDYSIREANSGIYSSLEAVTVAGHISQVVVDSTFQSQSADEIYELCVYCLYLLSTTPERYKIIYSAFNRRMLNIMGCAVNYDECSFCKQVLSEVGQLYLSIMDGNAVCTSCAKKLNTPSGQYSLVGYNTVQFLNFYSNEKVNRIFTPTPDDKTLDELIQFTTSSLSFHNDKKYDALQRLNDSLNLNLI